MIPNSLRGALIAISLSSAIFSHGAYALDEHNTVPGLTYAGAPLGLHGVDPVAFININSRIEGADKFTGVHNGVAYYFANQENLDAFKQAPSRFTPAYGGFCAFGASVGKKFDGDPRFAAVYKGKLYVFLNEAVLAEFNKDRDGTIAKANKNWQKIQHAAATSL